MQFDPATFSLARSALDRSLRLWPTAVCEQELNQVRITYGF